MRATPRLVAHWPWFALATVLLLLGTASWMSLRQNFDEDLKLTRESSGRELHVLAAFISVELQAGRYQDIERLLRDWGKTNSSIAQLQLVAANGFVLATYQRPGDVERALTLEQHISYSYRGEATLRLRIDLADVYRHQQRLATEFTIILAAGAMLLSLLVYVALQRQREAVGLRQRTQELDAATHALAKSEERLKLALEASSDGLWDWDVQANTAHFSPRWKAILGYADDELADSFETWYQRLHPEDQPRARAAQQVHFDDPTRAYPTFGGGFRSFPFVVLDGRFHISADFLCRGLLHVLGALPSTGVLALALVGESPLRSRHVVSFSSRRSSAAWA